MMQQIAHVTNMSSFEMIQPIKALSENTDKKRNDNMRFIPEQVKKEQNALFNDLLEELMECY